MASNTPANRTKGLTLTLFQKALILVAVPVLFEAVFFGSLFTMLHQAEVEVKREAHAKEVLLSLNQLMGYIMDASKHIAMYVAMRQEESMVKYAEVVKPVPQELASLRSLLQGDNAALQAMGELEGSTNETMSILADGVELVKAGDIHGGLRRIRDARRSIRLLDEHMEHVRAQARQVAAESSLKQEQARNLMKGVLTGGLLLSVLLAVSLAAYFNRGTTRRLALVMDNTRRLARRETLNPPVGGGDEIAHLDGFFRQMAEELENARQKELAVIENAEDVICSLDSSGCFAKVSPASVKVWGYEPEKLIGVAVTSILADEDKQATAATVDEFMSGAKSHPFECRVKRPDGKIVNTLWSAHWSERDKSLFCVAHDITDRKLAEDLLRASEARVRLIVESMPVGLLITDASGIIRMFNPTALTMFDYRAEDLEGRPLASLFVKDDRIAPSELMKELISRSAGRIHETDAYKQGGRSLPVQLSITAFDALDGPSYLAIMLDITERKEIERLKQEFVSMISHDLRTPLTSIQIFLNMLSRGSFGTLSETGMKKADMADRNASRLINLVNDLLDIEKMESGQLQLNREPVGLTTAIERSIESVKAFADKSAITLLVKESSDRQILADSDRLVQVIINLLGNAIKFSPRGGTITVATFNDADNICLQVIDQGRGVPAHLRQAIFERFKQVEAKDATEKKGTGLGLAICKAIIVQHGGEIGVESEEGKGSTFWFKLPVLREAASTVAQSDSQKSFPQTPI